MCMQLRAVVPGAVGSIMGSWILLKVAGPHTDAVESHGPRRGSCWWSWASEILLEVMGSHVGSVESHGPPTRLLLKVTGPGFESVEGMGPNVDSVGSHGPPHGFC